MPLTLSARQIYSDCMSFPEEATHPRCYGEGYPDWPGRASKQGGRVVVQHSRAFVGIDTSKLRNGVAVAEDGRGGDVRYLGEIDTTEAATRKLVTKLAAKYRQLTFCYEAGPTGYGLYRLIRKLGHDCIVAAPSLIPKKPGDRVKTNRRDAVGLAKLSRAGDLTAVWVPDERHEAMRDLSRAREAARKDLKGKRQQVSSFMLRLGRHYPGKKTWGPAHINWLMLQKLEHREQRIALEELLGLVFPLRRSVELKAATASSRVETLPMFVRSRPSRARRTISLSWARSGTTTKSTVRPSAGRASVGPAMVTSVPPARITRADRFAMSPPMTSNTRSTPPTSSRVSFSRSTNSCAPKSSAV